MSTKSEIPGAAAEEYSRRKFLETTGKGLIASAVLASYAPGSAHAAAMTVEQRYISETSQVNLPSLDDETEKKMSQPPLLDPPAKRKGYAIVGLGHLALNQILPAFGKCKHSKPVAVVSGDTAKARDIAAQYGIPEKGIYSYQNFDDIKNNPDIDAVYIVLPNSMHAEYTVRAAQAGKHVLCEKPMATSVADAEKMVEACKKANKKLMIAYRIQYEPHNKQAKEWTRSKEYGRVRTIEGYNGQHVGDPSQWRLHKKLSGGGAMVDIGVYCLNTFRYLTGEEPEWLFASTYSTPGDARFAEVEEAIMFQLRFPSGVIANCTASYGAHESRRYRCCTDQGAYIDLDPAFPYNPINLELSQAKGKNEWKQKIELDTKDQFQLELDHFSQCMAENKQPYTPGEEGVQDMKLIEAIYKSVREGKPVELAKVNTLDTYRGLQPVED